MLEQEIASIIDFALKYAGNPKPYYYNVPEHFIYPAMYFPQPEITTRGETFRTYAMQYSWYINIFCKTTEKAYEMAFKVITALKRKKNLIPLIDEQGYCGEGLRIDDPSLKKVDNGVIQLTIEWTSRRPYDADVVQKMMRYDVKMHIVEDLKRAYTEAVNNISIMPDNKYS